MQDNHDCLPFVKHMRCEHRRLNSVVQDTSKAIQLWKQDRKSSAPVAQHLQLLRDELQHHFAEEEGEGCLEEAVAHRPNVAGEMHGVIQEHGTLRTELDRLVAHAQPTGTQTANVEQLETDFLAFSKRLRIHEAAENHLLRSGFGAEAMETDEDCDCEAP